jgi:hypothetical protein
VGEVGKVGKVGKVRYLGSGGHIRDVPARDLSEEEFEQYKGQVLAHIAGAHVPLYAVDEVVKEAPTLANLKGVGPATVEILNDAGILSLADLVGVTIDPATFFIPNVSIEKFLAWQEEAQHHLDALQRESD